MSSYLIDDMLDYGWRIINGINSSCYRQHNKHCLIEEKEGEEKKMRTSSFLWYFLIHIFCLSSKFQN
jgi:hypothetical protein